MYSWEDLAGLALARQFAPIEGRGVADVADAVHRIGPIQSQTARSPYLGLAARMPGVTLEAISAAYEDLAIVRGSNIRGTVHTSTPEDSALLEVATRIGQRTLWARMLRLDRAALEDVWAATEDYARHEWRTANELRANVVAWLATHDPAAGAQLDNEAGRYLGFGHGGLVRRPLKGGWQGQGAAGYRTASELLGDRSRVLADPEGAMDRLVRRHLASHGPSGRLDLAWWAGVGLRVVDASLARLSGDLSTDTGPDGEVYHDLPGSPPPRDVSSVRLLPEFDALICAYSPRARERFVTPEHHARLWLHGNGLIQAPLMTDGRLTGFWRLPGSSARRPCEVTYFTGTRRPTRAMLAEPVAAVEAAYAVTVTGVSITREAA